MFKNIIIKYINKLTINDINNFSLKNNYKLKENEDIIILNFIKNNYQYILNKDFSKLIELKNKLSNETYNKCIELIDKYKNFI